MSEEMSIIALPAAEILPVTVIEEPKAKEKNSPPRPRYIEMVTDTIVTLKERNGSSHHAIAKHLQEKYKHLPANFKTLLLVQLKKLVAAGKLVKVKNSFKLPSAGARSKSAEAVAAVPAKKSGARSKESKSAAASVPAKKSGTRSKESKSAAAPAKKSAAKPVEKIKKGLTSDTNLTAKRAAKPKAKPDSRSAPANAKPNSKAKPAAKPKASAAKPKAKAADKSGKAAKTSPKTSPGKGAAVTPKPTLKKVKGTRVVKTAKAKEVKSPEKKTVKRGGKK